MQIPGYNIEIELGKGGMATVYLATQQLLDRKVALKVMNPSLAADDSFCNRFLKEGKTIAQFKHPNIVTIYDIGSFESFYFMAMEYVGGGTLKERIRQGPMGERSISIMRQIASALGYAHARGFIHRDIKPANILFQEDGTVLLSDFGIAKDLASDEQLTRMGYTVGTPEYMSPEQALGRSVDGRSDLYSLGVVFYEMLAARKPFVARDAFAVALMHANQPPPPLPDAASAYRGIVERLLAKDPKQRFATAEELLDALDVGSSHVALESTAESTNAAISSSSGTGVAPQKGAAARPHRKWPLPAAAAALAAAAGIYVYPTLMPDGGRDAALSNLPPPGEATDRVQNTTPPEVQSNALSPSAQAKIEQLIEVAEAHAAIGRLADPPGSNAYDAYKMVLKIDPNNERAKAGIKRLERELRQSEER